MIRARPEPRTGRTAKSKTGKVRSRESQESLAETCSGVIVVAHSEDTSLLRRSLEKEGLAVTEVRGPYREGQERFSRNIRCLINHANAWRMAAERERPSVIVEADFVPVIRFGSLPLPFSGRARGTGRFGWLYSAGSILYGIDELGLPYGHGNTTVAYALDREAATYLLGFFDREMRQAEPGAYRPWETYLGIYLRKECGVRNYLTPRQYGEHGGMANPEHQSAGARAWHEADVLAGRLAFLPPYACGSRARYRARRFRGWARGLYRLVTLRFFDPRDVNEDSARGRLEMAWFSARRLFSR